MTTSGDLLELEATSRAVLAAHEAHIRDATGNVRWERRGILQRLTRVDLPDGDQDAAARGRGGT